MVVGLILVRFGVIKVVYNFWVKVIIFLKHWCVFFLTFDVIFPFFPFNLRFILVNLLFYLNFKLICVLFLFFPYFCFTYSPTLYSFLHLTFLPSLNHPFLPPFLPILYFVFYLPFFLILFLLFYFSLSNQTDFRLPFFTCPHLKSIYFPLPLSNSLFFYSLSGS